MPEGKIDIVHEPIEQEVALYYGNLTEEQLGLISRAYSYELVGSELPLMVFVMQELVRPLSERIKQQYEKENNETIKNTAQELGNIL